MGELNSDTLLKYRALPSKHKREKATLGAEDKMGTIQNGRNKRAIYYDHIHNLFSLRKLYVTEQEVLSNKPVFRTAESIIAKAKKDDAAQAQLHHQRADAFYDG